MDEETPDQKFGKVTANFSIDVRSLFKYSTTSIKFSATIGFFSSFLGGAIFPIFMFIMARLAFDVLRGGSIETIVYMLLGLGVFSFFIHGVSTSLLEYVSNKQVISFRKHFFKAIVHQDMEWFDSIDTGTLVTRLEENLVLIREALGSKINQVFMFLSMLVFSVGFAFYSEPRLTAVLIVGYPVMIVAMFFASQNIIKAQKQSLIAYESAGALVEESTLHVRVVRANNAELRIKKWYIDMLMYAEKVIIKSGLIAALGIGCLICILFIMYTIGVFYGGSIGANFIENNPGLMFEADKVLRVLMMMTATSFMLGQVIPLLLNVSKGIFAASNLSQIIDRAPKIDVSSNIGIKDVDIQGRIEFKNVSFSYAKSMNTVFDNISFTIKPGQTIALVGPSGIGKSTVTSLLQRFYDPTEGEIVLDGIPLQNYNVEFLRSKIAIISQQPRLFSMSIRENIQFGNHNSSYEDIVRVAKYAYAHDFIKEFPDKYETLAGEGGSSLSGGQKQRIAIARAMLREPSIYILDEATAALDVESEKLVQQAFESLMSDGKKTTIVVAHRLSTIKNADHIFVFGRDNGMTKIIEHGTHTTLAADTNSTYYSMMKTQMIDSELETSSGSDDFSNPSQVKREYSITSIAGTIEKQDEEESSKNFFSKLYGKIRRKSLSPKARKMQKLIFATIYSDPIPFICLTISSIIVGLSFPSLAFILTSFIQVLLLTDPVALMDGVRQLTYITMSIAVIAGFCSFVQYACISISGQKLVTKLRKSLFNHLMSHPIAFYDNPKNSVGFISSILASDVNLIHQGYILNSGLTIQLITTLCFSFFYTFFVNWLLAISIFIPFLILIPITMVRVKKLSKMNTKGDTNDFESSAFLLHESLIGIHSVTSYGLQNNLYERYVKRLAAEQGPLISNALRYGFAMGISMGGIFLISALGFYVGTLAIERDPDSAMDVARALFLVMYAARSINQNASFTADMGKARIATENLGEIINLDYSNNIERDEVDISPEQMKGHIKINNLRFEYPQRQTPIYSNVTFDILPGQVVALVGESGSGKSTIVQLLEKFYDYDLPPPYSLKDSSSYQHPIEMEQMITIDGRPLSQISAKSIRQITGYVSQDPSIFNSTILENITIGKPDATMEEVYAACKTANIHDFIMTLPEQYKTPTGRLGGKLSGGQKQRLAIARAIIRNPKFLLLDEATSALDAEGEATVQSALDEVLSENTRTSLVIAHRLSTIRNADKIVVLKAEKKFGSHVIETGTHNELIKLDGTYKDMLNTAAT